MPSADIPDEKRIRSNGNLGSETEADKTDAAAGSKSTTDDKTGNDTSSLLRQNLYGQNQGSHRFSQEESELSKNALISTTKLIIDGQLLVSSLWTAGIVYGDAVKSSDVLDEQRQDKAPDKPSNKPYLENTQPTDAEFDPIERSLPVSPELLQKLVDVMDAIKKDRKESWKKIKELINATGRPPKDAVIEAVENSDFTGLGETHTGKLHTGKYTANPMRAFGISIMKDLYNSGATHLAVELPKIVQPVLDKFNNDADKGKLEIPDELIGPDGKIDASPEAKGGLLALKSIIRNNPDLAKLFRSARDSGMKIVCADNNAVALSFSTGSQQLGPFSAPEPPGVAKLMTRREQDIADNIVSIFDQPVKAGERPTKVVGLFGGLHFVDSHGREKQKRAGELLREELAKRNKKMTTFDSQIGNGDGVEGTSLYPLTSALAKPVSVATHDQNGNENILGQSYFLSNTVVGPRWADLDHVLVFPKVKDPIVGKYPELQQEIDEVKDTKPAPMLKPAQYVDEILTDNKKVKGLNTKEEIIEAKKELNIHGQPPIDVLAEAMKNSRVLGIAISHERTAAQSLAVMKSLKSAGATHLVVPYIQNVLDEFARTGSVDSNKIDHEIDLTAVPLTSLIDVQAALQNGLKLVSSRDISTKVDRVPASTKEAEVVRNILRDKDAKVILLTDPSHLANIKDDPGQKSAAQLIRSEPDPLDPSQRIKFTSVVQTGVHAPFAAELSPVTQLMTDLKHPVAVQLSKLPTLSRVQGVYAYHLAVTTLNLWDILVAWP